MNKKLKLALLIVVIALVSFIGLLVVGYMMLDPNDFKQEISAIVKEKTGQELVISGNIEKSIYPNLGVNIGAVALKNPSGYEAENFAQLERVSVSISLMPLFSGKIIADTVLLQGAKINLEKNGAGKANWEVLAQSAKGDDKDKKDKQKDTSAKELDTGKFQFEGMEIVDASLTFVDKQSGQKVVLDKINLTTELEELSKPFLVKFSAQMANEKPKATADFDLKTLVTLSKDLKQIKLEDLVAKLNADAPDILPTKLETQLQTEVDLDLAQMAVVVKDLKLKLLDLMLKANINAKNLAANPALDANIELARFNPRDLVKKLNIELPEMQGKDALSAIELKAAIVGTLKKLELKELKVILDQTNVDGNAVVNNLMDPATTFTLNVDKINIDNYLPPKSEKVEQQQQVQAAAKKEKVDLEPLRKLNLNGVINVGEVIVQNLKAENIKVTIKAKDGIIQANPVNADLYQGKLDANFKLDARTDNPKIAIKEKLIDFQAGPFTKDLMEKERISGNANVNADITAAGMDPEEVKKTLNGDVSFKFLDGAVKGINLGKMIREGQAVLRGGEASEQEQTDFAEISGTAKIVNGIVQNNDLKAQSPLLRVTGKGKVDLPQNQVDYVAVVALVATSKGQGGKELMDLKKAPIPLKIKGDIAKPEIGLDFEEAMKLVGEKKTQEVKDKVEKKLQEKVGDKLGGKLKGLFGK